MTRLVDVISPAPRADWDRIVAACPYATFHQSRQWAEAYREAFPGAEALARHYRFDDGVEALVPGNVETSLKGALREFRSAPPSECAGVVSPSRLTAKHMELISDDLCSAGFALVVVYENPFEIQPPLHGFAEVDDFTQAIPVGEADGFRARLTSKERQNMRRALAAKVTVERHTGGEGVDQMYAMYLRSSERWGDATTWVRPLDFVRTACLRSEDAVVRLARVDGVVVGATAEYHFGRVSQLGMRGFDYEYRNYYPNLLLLAEAYREAAERGAEFLDMGASSGLEGVIESKERVGCVRLGFRVWQWENPLYRVYSAGRRRIDLATAAVHPGTRC